MKNNIAFVIGIFFLLLSPTLLYSQPGADSLLKFIQQNKSRSSLFLKRNDTVIARLEENKLMPLASTVKIMVAIEFAKQAAHSVFNENKKVSLSELDKYYLPNTDGDAHPAWINYERKLGDINSDSAKLIDVARGMIMFSSNANTEYLMDMLGFDNVKNNTKLLGLKQHTAIYPLVASLFIYQNPRKVSEDKILEEIDKMSDDNYSKAALYIHNELKNDSSYKKKFRPQDLTIKMQKEWSKRLPSSTTKEYVQLCTILNNRKYFDAKTYDILAEVLESLMEKPANKAWLSHAGMKGGSTIFVLTKALYATLKDGTTIEMSYFFNDLGSEENHRLQSWMNDFEIQVLTNESFRTRIVF